MKNNDLDFYIFNAGGVPLYSYAKSKHDIGLISSFMSVIQKLSNHLINDDLSNIAMGEKLLYFHKSNCFDIYYVMISGGKDKGKKVKSKLEKIAKDFESNYGKIIPGWSGDQNKFSDFDNYFKQEELNVERMAYILFGMKPQKNQ